MELQRVHAPERQRVGGDFHRQVRPANSRKIVKETVQIQRLRRSVYGLQRLCAQAVLDRADNTRGSAGRLQDGIDQVASGRLSVSTGDAGDRDGFIEPAVEISR